MQIPSTWWDARTEFTVGVTCQARAVHRKAVSLDLFTKRALRWKGNLTLPANAPASPLPSREAGATGPRRVRTSAQLSHPHFISLEAGAVGTPCWAGALAKGY